jgi:hypothetical protein
MNSFYQGKLLKYQAILQSWSNFKFEYASIAVALAQIANSVSIIEETQVKQKTCKSMCCYSSKWPPILHEPITIDAT